MKRVLLIVGTRPEAIKVAPVVLAMRESGIVEMDMPVDYPW